MRQGRAHVWPRGKVLGGSSSINGLLYVRGQRADYDGWRQLGCEGWGWDDVRPYFLRAQNQERGASPHHGVGGPLNVSDVTQTHRVSDAVIEACEEAGIPRNDDINGESQEGAGYQLTVKNGQRYSGRRRLSASGDETSKPSGRDQRPRRQGDHRGRPRGRRGVHSKAA